MSLCKRQHLTALLIAPAFVFASASMASANLLENASFEDGTDSWTENRSGGSPLSASTDVTANTGEHSLKLLTGRGSSQFITAIQSGVETTPGQHDASVYVYDDGAVSNKYRFVMTVVFSDGSSNLASFATGGLDSGGLTDNAWNLITLSDYAEDPIIAPAGTTEARFTFDWRPRASEDQTGDPGSVRTLYIDDAALAFIPEPVSITMLGLGGLAMFARRRGAADWA